MAKKLESAMDYEQHEKSYEVFIKIAKYGTVLTIAALVFLAVVTL